MKLVQFILSAVTIVASPVAAQVAEVKNGPVPDWVVRSDLLPVPDDATGLVFLRRQDILVHLNNDGQFQYTGSRIKILHQNGLQIGNVAIRWNPAAGAPLVHAVKIYRQGEAIDVLKKASFEILRREDQLETGMLTGLLTAILHVPDLRVGDEIEVEFTTSTRDPNLGQNDAGVMLIGPTPPQGRVRIGLSWSQNQPPHIKMSPDMTTSARKGDHSVEFLFDNPKPLMPPKDAPARYQWQRTVEYSDFADWAAVSRHFWPLYVKASEIAERSPLKAEARRIMAANVTPLDRAKAALKLVQQDVRYIFVGLNGGNLKPAPADETWQRRFGDCKAKTVLLLALLSEMGIEGEAVLASNTGADDGLDERLPNPGLFDHVLVRARIGDATYYLDGTLPPVAPPSVEPVVPYKWLLPLSARGEALQGLGWVPAKQPDEITLYEIDARAGFAQPAKITSTTITRGIDGLRNYALYSGLVPSELEGIFRQQMTGDLWQSVDNVQWRYDEKARASVLKITGSGTIDWQDDGDGAKSYALPGGGFSPPERRARPADQDKDAPYSNKPEFNCRVTTIRLPAETRSRQWSFKKGYDTRLFGRNYYRAIELREGAIRMVRGSRVEKQEIDAASAQQDNAGIARFDNSMAWIFYDPAGREVPPNNGPVPATYDLDWTADQVPCLATPAADRAKAKAVP